MSLYQSILLGLVQGLTEFLPVSSSGHLVILQKLVHFNQNALSFDAVLHLGTLVAVVVYFRREVSLMAGSAWRWLRRRQKDEYTVLVGYLLAASVPAAVVGVVFEKIFSDAFDSVLIVGMMLIITGLVLWVSETRAVEIKTLDSLTLRDSIWVGLAQTAAIMPGLSRSGATIGAGLWRGFRRKDAAGFSFLLSIPVTAGAALVSLKDGISLVGLPMMMSAATVAAISGFLAIGLLMRLIQAQKLRLFAVYCFIMGSLAIALAFAGW